jgi:hypothetical protein
MSYPKSYGFLYKNESSNPEAPISTGKLEITDEQMERLTALKKAGEEMELDLGCWRKTSAKGNDYLSLKAEAPRLPEGTSAAPASEPEFHDDKLPF